MIQDAIDRISRMKPRIMASNAEISMTPIRMMSRSVMGMIDLRSLYTCTTHLHNAGGRIGDTGSCTHVRLTFESAGGPNRMVSQPLASAAVIALPARTGAVAGQGRQPGRCIPR